jgi:hypothetical protein
MYKVLVASLIALSSIAISLMILVGTPVLCGKECHSGSVFRDPRMGWGWRMTKNFGQCWIDIDTEPIIKPTFNAGQSSKAGIIDFGGFSAAPARLVNAGDNEMPHWVPTSLPFADSSTWSIVGQGFPFVAAYHYRRLDTKGDGSIKTMNWIDIQNQKTRRSLPPLRDIGLPYRIVWFGMVLNWAFYCLTMLSVYIVGVSLKRKWRKLHNRCDGCGYDLRKSKSVCPECGERRPRSVD